MEPIFLNWRPTIYITLSFSSLSRIWGPVDLWDGHHSFLDEAMVKHISRFFFTDVFALAVTAGVATC